MDQQNRVGSKFGGGGVASTSETNMDRRERLRKLALETIDLDKDPYIMHTHIGTIECRLCQTMHKDEGSYLTHTQGRKHQTNLGRRAARDNRDQALAIMPRPTEVVMKKRFMKIGRPAYRITKFRQDQEDGGLQGILFQVAFPLISPNVQPIKRLMSAFDPDQKQETPDSSYQYLEIAAEPYETIAVKIESRPLADANTTSVTGQLINTDHMFENWDKDTQMWFVFVGLWSVCLLVLI